MAWLIDLDGLPDQVEEAIAETVANLKIHYPAMFPDETKTANVKDSLKDLPSYPGRVIGSLRRVEIYEDR